MCSFLQNASHVIYYPEGSYVPSNTTGQGGSLLVQHYLLPGKVVVAPAANLQDMPDGCDKSCRKLPGCNTYAYCPGYNADEVRYVCTRLSPTMQKIAGCSLRTRCQCHLWPAHVAWQVRGSLGNAKNKRGAKEDALCFCCCQPPRGCRLAPHSPAAGWVLCEPDELHLPSLRLPAYVAERVGT